MTTVLNDLRFALRQLRHAPGFALTAVLTLALGIGACTAMYSIIRSTLLEPLPYPHQQELVGIGWVHNDNSPQTAQTGVTADFLLQHATSFAQIGLSSRPQEENFSTGSGTPVSIRYLNVSSGYLPTLGVAPLLGRTFTREEDQPGGPASVVLSEGLWHSALGSNPHVIGLTVRLNGDPYTVVGVMPSRFATVDSPDVWHPLRLSSSDPGYIGTNYDMIARLRPGIQLAQANAEMTAMTHALLQQYPYFLQWAPHAPPLHERVWPLEQVIVSSTRPALLMVSAAVLAIMFIGCLNLAGLMTARALARRAEIAIRSALGAQRSAVMRLLLAESALLALAGSALGLLFAASILPLLVHDAPLQLPNLHHAVIDLHVLLFALLSGCAAALLFGLLPAIGAFRFSLATMLNGGRTAGESAPRQRLGKLLLAAQVASATALISVAAVLLGTFVRMRSIPPGVRPEHLDIVQVHLEGAKYAAAQPTQQFIAALEQRLQAIPGVARVAAVSGLPLDRGLNNSGGPAGHPELMDYVETRFVTPGYFRTIGTPLLAGQEFSDSNNATSQPVALINERAAKVWFHGRSALGEFVVDGDGKPLRVIGIVALVHEYSLADSIDPTIYIPYAQVQDQTARIINRWFPTTFVLRLTSEGNAGDPEIQSVVAHALAQTDSDVPIAKFATMESFIDRTIAAPRFFSWLASSFGGFALLLTVIGLFGLLSYQVAARQREIALRMALGADRMQILTTVMWRATFLTGCGVGCGALLGVFLQHVIAHLMPLALNLDPQDLATLLISPAAAVALAAICMLLVSMAASLAPAQRAASVEPMEALRAE